MKVLTAMLLMAAATPVAAQVQVPNVTEEQKVNALMLAYKANGNSMVGWGSFDATGMFVKGDEAQPIRTIPIIPVTPAHEKNALDAIADMTNPEPAPKADICKRHGMHKVTTGNSWRCRK